MVYMKKYSYVIVLFLPLIFFSCAEKNGLGEKAPEKEYPDVEIVDFVTRSYKGGKVSWHIKAKKGEIYSSRKITKLFEFNLYNYDDKGSLVSTASALEGILWEDTEDIFLKGSVVLLNEDKTVLETDTLKFIQKENKIRTRDWVKITRANGDVLRGKGLIGDMGLKKMEILSRVSIESYK